MRKNLFYKILLRSYQINSYTLKKLDSMISFYCFDNRFSSGMKIFFHTFSEAHVIKKFEILFLNFYLKFILQSKKLVVLKFYYFIYDNLKF